MDEFHKDANKESVDELNAPENVRRFSLTNKKKNIFIEEEEGESPWQTLLKKDPD